MRHRVEDEKCLRRRHRWPMWGKMQNGVCQGIAHWVEANACKWARVHHETQNNVNFQLKCCLCITSNYVRAIHLSPRRIDWQHTLALAMAELDVYTARFLCVQQRALCTLHTASRMQPSVRLLWHRHSSNFFHFSFELKTKVVCACCMC